VRERQRAHARQMRSDATDAERALWRHLRAHHLAGRKFRRQQPIGPFIVDFVCHASSLIVEVDGGQHLESDRDAQRDAWLRQQGFTVLRFWNDDVLARTDAVVEEVLRHLPLSPRPSPARGEGSVTERRP
jgi:very-short-patch-repair endonuclease